jgi:uncharacterized membrane protein
MIGERDRKFNATMNAWCPIPRNRPRSVQSTGYRQAILWVETGIAYTIALAFGEAVFVKLFDELKRRNVIRVAVAYAVASWLLLQVADLVIDNISAPAWVMQVFMLAMALGFPLVLVFSWAFELTPEGLKRDKEVDRQQSVAHYTARKLDRYRPAGVAAR